VFEAVFQLAEQGWQFVRRRYSSRGFHRFEGNVEDVLRQIVLANWNGRYLSCGIGNHTIVYVRDLSISAEALIRTGFLSEVRRTVNFMMKAFIDAGKVTTTVNQHGGAYDTFEYGSDTLPYLMRLLRLTDAYEIVEQHHEFFARAVRRYERLVIDQETGLVRTDRSYSTQKDIHTRRGCAYDNVCLLLLRDELARAREAGLRLPDPFAKFDRLTDRFVARFWTGRYFRDTVRGHPYVASDANLFPYFFDVITDAEMAHASLTAIQHAGLDSPIPAAYTRVRVRRTENTLMRFLSPNYQGNSSWTLLGGLYLTVLAKSDHPDADRVARFFHELIDSERTCLELYQPDGRPFKTWTYRTDEAMLWSAVIYAQLLELGTLGEPTIATPTRARNGVGTASPGIRH
jgi:hypothetical protein